GLPKSSIDLIKTKNKDDMIPGIASGNVTDLKTENIDAPKLKAASSTEGSIDSKTPHKFKNANGKKAKVCTTNKFVKPYTFSSNHNNPLEITPFLPNNKMTERAITNGGDMIGNRAIK